MTDERIAATRDSWQTVDCKEPFVALPWHDSFSESQFDLIRRGAIPESMDDRWFAFYEEPMLFLYRSWSGHLIYRVTFARTLDDRLRGVVMAFCARHNVRIEAMLS